MCGFSFESSPAWLWAFRISDWETIYLTDKDEVTLRQYHNPTWSFVKDRLSIIGDYQIRSMAGTVDVWFVSGSRQFLEEFCGPVGTPMMMWAERCGRRRPVNTFARSWFGISHETVGGSTTARGVFGVEMMDGFAVPIDSLRRGISHIMKYSIRPDPCEIPVQEAHYVISDRLSMHRIDQPVVYATGFSRSGWGKRPLSDGELAQAFDLPSYISWNPCFPKDIVPIQIFRVVVDAVLISIRPSIQGRAGARPCTSVSRLTSQSGPLPIDAEWLENLQRWLPGSWANVSIADRAVKSDNARIEQFPWNQRISLVLSLATGQSIIGMELLGLKIWQSSLLKSFFRYLRMTYGGDWRQCVMSFIRNFRWQGGESRGSKRKLCELDPGENHKWGGCDAV